MSQRPVLQKIKQSDTLVGRLLRQRGYRRMLRNADDLARQGRMVEARTQLREQMTLEEFGSLLLEVPDNLPALKEHLPCMPPDAVQKEWTGAWGRGLLEQTLSFVASLEEASRTVRGHSLSDARILDYGCGWGRVMRILLKYVEPDRIYGADPWQRSLDLCKEYGVPGHLALCDYVPKELAFGRTNFDVVYAFSVFTHLSQPVATQVQRVLRERVSDNSLFAITIRPYEYWSEIDASLVPGIDLPSVERDHREHGFGFAPHSGVGETPFEEGDDPIYGETSMEVDWIRENWKEWRVIGSYCSTWDSLQQYVFLAPA